MLPIYEIEQELLRALKNGNCAVLSAPTGSGKTTQVPRMLHGSGLVDGQVVVLQPRRLATRMVARRVADEMGVEVGGLVGYQTRNDSRCGPDTALRFMTYGLFLTVLRTDPELAGIGAVILDEFHERQLEADVALALARRLQRGSRPDLKLLVMSATLDVELVAGFLDCPVIESGHRAHPVAIRYLATDGNEPAWRLAADALVRLVNKEPEGDVLVFMPGMGEIRRTMDAFQERYRGTDILVLPLHGALPDQAQDQAVGSADRRKIVVSTNVAETSLTIPGVRHVVDAGLARKQRFDQRRGINTLTLQRISVSSADQRAGRAGRTAPGTCLRLWSKHDHRGRARHETPEVRRLDLAQTVLLLAAVGIVEPAGLSWLEPPDAEAVQRATALLKELGSLADGPNGLELTGVGDDMSRLPMHPRLARLLIEGHRLGWTQRACRVAALLSERDVMERGKNLEFSRHRERDHLSDFDLLLDALDVAGELAYDRGRCSNQGLKAAACQAVEQTAKLYARSLRRVRVRGGGAPSGTGRSDLAARCLLAAFSDQVAARRGAQSAAFDLPGGRSAGLSPHSVAVDADLLVSAQITELSGAGGRSTTLSLNMPVDHSLLLGVFPERVSTRRLLAWNDEALAVEQVERTSYGDLAVHEKRANAEPGGEAEAILAQEITERGLKLKGWTDKVDEWIARVRCVGEWFPEKELLAYDSDDVKLVVQELCAGATRYRQVRDRPCLDIVKNVLSWADQQFVAKMAPERIRLPSGWKMRVSYQPGERPRGRAKIQDLYDVQGTPAVAGGRQVLVLEILGPNFRPVQTTEDLAGFWVNHYPKLKGWLSRRYPRHEWR